MPMPMMNLLPLLAAAVLSTREGVVVSGFSTPSPSRPAAPSRTSLHASAPNGHNDEPSNMFLQRRTLLSNLLAASATVLIPTIASADSVPSVTSSEFDTILKDSAKSVLSVELSGPKSETAVVRLADGTTFTISDLVESSTDPRSPLKLVARCRLYKIPVKNTGLLSAVSGDGNIIGTSGKKKKSYMNPRVQKAEKLQQAMRERMAEDERERLEELYKMEAQEEGFLKE